VGSEQGAQGRRWRKVALIAASVVASLVVLAVAAVLYVRSRDSATAVPVGEAVDEFREASDSVVATAELPPPGVYVYDTVGDERVDALGGISHTYPAETTITVTHTDCGYQLRWDALRERWDELNVCVTPDGETIESARQYHEFFGVANEQTFDCDPARIVIVDPPVEGDTHTSPCAGGSSTNDLTITVVGVEPIEVGGQTIDAVKIHVSSALAGDVRGTSELDYWAHPDNALVLRRVSRVVTDANSPLGTTRYEEGYTIHLRSLEPRT
jgi:hypothetical protein